MPRGYRFYALYTHAELAFVQNLIFYIEEAYRLPDYGVWERGAKTNHGDREINASSIGMCLAALEACNDLKFFSSEASLHVIPDDISRARLTINSLLPKESSSKEVDSGILFALSYPGFIAIDHDVKQKTYRKLFEKLSGKYGLKRFLRDGYNTEGLERKVVEHVMVTDLLFILSSMLYAIRG